MSNLTTTQTAQVQDWREKLLKKRHAQMQALKRENEELRNQLAITATGSAGEKPAK